MIYKPDMTLLESCQDMSLSLLFLKRAARASSLLLYEQWKPGVACLLLTIPAVAFGQNYARQAAQFPMPGRVPEYPASGCDNPSRNCKSCAQFGQHEEDCTSEPPSPQDDDLWAWIVIGLILGSVTLALYGPLIWQVAHE